MKRFKRLKIITSLVLVTVTFSSGCSSSLESDAIVENTIEPTAKVIAEESILTEDETIELTPTSTLDISSWIVKVGDMECILKPLGEEYPDWYLVDCPEDLWLPIGQTSIVDVLVNEENCALRSMEMPDEIIQEYFSASLQLDFTQIEDGQWGCQIPYSDTAGLEVVCGFEVDCEGVGEELRVLIFGKTIRVYSGGGSSSNGDNDGNGGSQSVPPPPPPPGPNE